MAKKKWIRCYDCKAQTWGRLIAPTNIVCGSCGSVLNLFKVKQSIARDRKAARALKAEVINLPPRIPPKKRKERDTAYMTWIKTLPCMVTGTVNPKTVDAHHHIRKSQGGSDRTCVPLLHELHMELHTIGVETFENKYDLDFEATVKRLNATYDKLFPLASPDSSTSKNKTG